MNLEDYVEFLSWRVVRQYSQITAICSFASLLAVLYQQAVQTILTRQFIVSFLNFEAQIPFPPFTLNPFAQWAARTRYHLSIHVFVFRLMNHSSYSVLWWSEILFSWTAVWFDVVTSRYEAVVSLQMMQVSTFADAESCLSSIPFTCANHVHWLLMYWFPMSGHSLYY